MRPPAPGSHRRNVFSIAPGVPYLGTFVRCFLSRRIVTGFPATGDPLELASATLYVPTRRAARALQGEFAKAISANATLLPRIVPLGQLDRIETGLLFDSEGFDAPPSADLPDAIGEVARRLALMQMILAWTRALPAAVVSMDADGCARGEAREAMLVAGGPAQAWHLAGDLAGLIDEMIIEGLDWSALHRLVPDNFDIYWSVTLEFLEIAMTQWPAYLAEQGLTDAASRQARLIDREVARLQSGSTAGAGGPIVAIGSTGTNKATARLLAAIAAAPRGAIVLPGLDFDIDEAAWQSLGASRQEFVQASASHPQSALRRLLRELAIGRDGVVELAAPAPALALRARFVSEAMRPAATTEHWRRFAADVAPAALDEALGGIAIIEAADECEEALALAIALREVLETPGRTAALITPDRDLAWRVRGELTRWEISVDDSGGEALGATSYGGFARLAIAAIAADNESRAQLALLEHEHTRLGLARADVEERTHRFEIGVARVLLPSVQHHAELVEAARAAAQDQHAHPAARRITAAEWDDVDDLLERLTAALAPLRELAAGAPLAQWVVAHAEALVRLAEPGDQAADGGEAASIFAELVTEIAASAGARECFDVRSYAAFFDVLTGDARAHGPRENHPRLKILGLLEARLLDADVVLLGGLDEAIWPPKTQTDAFLNRPMRAEIGLSQPERRIGQTAHDFAQAMGSPTVIISRAAKRGGTPTVASRFLQRMQALASEAAWGACRARGARWLAYARGIDRPASGPTTRSRPQPRPPLALRPTLLSVTRIETLRRDPYAIYAERILRLVPLEQLGASAGAREMGTDIHALLADFVHRYPAGAIPPESAGELLELAREKFGRMLDVAAFRAFGWPRMAAIFPAFVQWEAARREATTRVDAEVQGRLDIPLSDGSSFRLTAIADRIERLADGGVHVIDYKTGRVPTKKEVAAGFAPQLILEAAMVGCGGFPAFVAGTQVADALYLKLADSGPYKASSAADKTEPLAQLVADQYLGLISLLEHFRNEANPYVPRPFPQFALRFGTYDHLARVKEWSAGSGSGGA